MGATDVTRGEDGDGDGESGGCGCGEQIVGVAELVGGKRCGYRAKDYHERAYELRGRLGYQEKKNDRLCG